MYSMYRYCYNIISISTRMVLHTTLFTFLVVTLVMFKLNIKVTKVSFIKIHFPIRVCNFLSVFNLFLLNRELVEEKRNCVSITSPLYVSFIVQGYNFTYLKNNSSYFFNVSWGRLTTLITAFGLHCHISTRKT